MIECYGTAPAKRNTGPRQLGATEGLQPARRAWRCVLVWRPLASYRNDERLVLGATGMDHQGLHGRTCIIAGEMRDIARDDRGFTQFDHCAAAPFDLDDEIAVERVQ